MLLKQYKAQNKLKEIDACLALFDHEIQLTDEEKSLCQQIAGILYDDGFSPPDPAALANKIRSTTKNVNELLHVMQINKEVIRLDEGIWLHSERLTEAEKKLVAYLKTNKEITVSQFKTLLGDVSRKFAMPLLQYFDSQNITARDKDVRVLVR